MEIIVALIIVMIYNDFVLKEDMNMTKEEKLKLIKSLNEWNAILVKAVSGDLKEVEATAIAWIKIDVAQLEKDED